ncbi:hypothetical protein BGZ94_004585, partial [Podila epigama]
LDSTFDEIKVENDEMITLLEKAAKTPEGTVLVKSPVETFVEESTKSVCLALNLEYSSKTQEWSKEMIEEHYLGVNYVELYPAKDVATTSHDIVPLKGPGTVLQSIQVYHKEPDEPPSAIRPVRIARSAIDKTGTIAATLSYTTTRGYLDLWKLQFPLETAVDTIREPVASASFPITRNKFGRPPNMELSMSHDAAQIAVFPGIHFEREPNGKIPEMSRFKVYSYNPSFTPALQDAEKESSVHQMQVMTRSLDSWLYDFAGAGKFHFLSIEDDEPQPNAADERFVGSDGKSLAIYSITGKWKQCDYLMLTEPVIAADGPTNNDDDDDDKEFRQQSERYHKDLTASLIDGMRGPYFAWQEFDKSGLTIWDLRRIEQISFLTFYESSGKDVLKHVCFSSDGAHMSLISSNGTVRTLLTRGLTPIDSSSFRATTGRLRYMRRNTELLMDMPGRRLRVANSMFTRGDHLRVFIPITTGGQTHLRAITLPDLDAVDINQKMKTGEKKQTGIVEDTITENTPSKGRKPQDGQQEADEKKGPTEEEEEQEEEDQDEETEFIYLQQGSMISIYHLANETVRSPSENPHWEKCTPECGTEAGDLTEKPLECTTPAGITFRLTLGRRIWNADDMRFLVDLAILSVVNTDSTGTTTATEILSLLHLDQFTTHHEVYFLPCKERFFIRGTFYFQIWELPTQVTDDCKLIVMHSCDVEFTNLEEIDENTLSAAAPCRHGNTVRMQDSNSTESRLVYVPPYDEGTPILDTEACVNSLPFVIVAYYNASDNYQRMILKYVNQHVNMWTKNGNNIIFRTVGLAALVEMTQLFLTDLLAFESDNMPTWIPLGKNDYNPMIFVLETAKSSLALLPLAAIIIEYCTKQAKESGDISYIAPILEILPELVENHPDLALQAIHRSAFIPSPQDVRVAAITHARVRPPPRLFSLFRRADPHITTVPNPVFQVRNFVPNKPLARAKDPELAKFTSDIYVASFDMLWRFDETEGFRTSERGTNWLKAILSIVALKFRVHGSNRVYCHELGEQLFDNPAIAALLEFKW